MVDADREAIAWQKRLDGVSLPLTEDAVALLDEFEKWLRPRRNRRAFERVLFGESSPSWLRSH